MVLFCHEHRWFNAIHSNRLQSPPSPSPYHIRFLLLYPKTKFNTLLTKHRQPAIPRRLQQSVTKIDHCVDVRSFARRLFSSIHWLICKLLVLLCNYASIWSPNCLRSLSLLPSRWLPRSPFYYILLFGQRTNNYFLRIGISHTKKYIC